MQSGTKDLQLSDRLRNSIYVDKEKRAIMLSNQTDMQPPARNSKLKVVISRNLLRSRMNENIWDKIYFLRINLNEVAIKVFKDIIFEKLGNDS